MHYFYFDASALAKRYVEEIGSDKIDFLFANVPLTRLRCLAIGAVEVFWICVRKRNDGRISADQFAESTTHLKSEIIDTQSNFRKISVPDSLVWDSMRLIETHSLNSVDAIVLRSALTLQQNSAAQTIHWSLLPQINAFSEPLALRDCKFLTQK